MRIFQEMMTFMEHKGSHCRKMILQSCKTLWQSKWWRQKSEWIFLTYVEKGKKEVW